MTFNLIFVHIVFSSVWVAEWPAADSIDHIFSLYFDYLYFPFWLLMADFWL